MQCDLLIIKMAGQKQEQQEPEGDTDGDNLDSGVHERVLVA